MRTTTTMTTTTAPLSSKRATDVAMALGALIVLAPVFAVVALCLWLKDASPFSKETRVGKNGREFSLYSFGGPLTTTIGRFIQRANIAKLPQLCNVVAGDMSFFGPRPAVPSEVARDTASVRRRLAVTPGLIDLDLINIGLTFQHPVALNAQAA